MLGGRFRVEGTLGKGGQGEVLAAVDTWLYDRPVALKRVPHEAAEVLRAEFTALRRLRHPALVEAIDLNLVDGVTHLVEARIEGQPLRAWADGRSETEVAAIVVPAVHALAHLHARGLVHLDVTPNNLLIPEDGSAVLIDLGLARPVGRTGASGTPGFVAPEVLASEPATGAADVYSVAVTLATVIAGGEPAAWGRPDLSAVGATELRSLLASCLADAAASRPSAMELATHLAELTGGDTGVLRRPLTDLPLCGRRDELAEFDRWLAEGQGTWSLAGAGGIGKSALLSACADRARLAGFTVFEVSAADGGAIDRLLRQAVARVPDGAHLLHTLGAELADLVDDARLPPPSNRLRTAAERAQLAVLALDALADELPVLVSVDDADAEVADAPTCAAVGIWSSRDAVHGARVMTAMADSSDAALTLSPLAHHEIEAVLHLAYAAPRPRAESEHVLEQWGGAPAATLAALNVAGERDCSLLELLANDVPAAVAQALPVPLQALAASETPLRERVVRRLVGDANLLARAVADGQLRVDVGSDGPAYLVPAAVRQATDPSSDAAAALATALNAEGDALAAAVAWARAGDRRQMRQALDGAETERPDALLMAWSAVARHLDGAALGDERIGRWATLAAAAGDLEATNAAAAALSACGRAAEARALVAACRIKVGDYAGALEAVTAQDSQPAAAAVRARALLFTGRAAAARELAQASWQAADGTARADLLDVLGHAAFQEGDAAAAQEALRRAREEAEAGGDAQALGRAHHSLAIVLHRGGDTAQALALYRASLDNADSLATVVRTLNLATVLQDLGELVEARRLYRDVLSRAVALANVREQARVGVNLANLEVLLGELTVAAGLAHKTLTLCRDVGLTHAAAMAALVAGEAYLERQEIDAAAEVLGEAESLLVEIEDPVALSELALLRARLSAARGEQGPALAEIERVDCQSGADHLARMQAFWRARLRLDLGAAPEPSLDADAEEAVRLARQSDDRELLWRALAVAARIKDRAGDGAAEGVQRAASEALEAWLQPLPEDVRTTYLATAERRKLHSWIGAVTTSEEEMSTTTSGSAAYRRLLAINRRLAREHEIDALLEAIVDTAIELLGAERGFLILRDGEAVNVAVARNFDRQSLEDGRQRISRSIASEALRAGEPLLTTNAQQDERFADIASVAMLKVRSVMCVPLRGTARDEDPVIGALYVDHRFQERAFTDADVELCAAFADQAAIALENARLLEQTREQERALQAQNERLERLNAQLRKEAAEYAEEAEAALRRLREEGPTVGVGRGFERIVGRSDALREALRLVDRFADTDVPVFISGDSGTGKELIARAIHERSARNRKAFVSVNCGAIPENLIESELFGYKKGAFTGAVRDKGGLFGAAEGGTLLLDEIGEMPLTMQVKLLRVLQEREYRPVGATADVPADVRIVSASHRNLEKLVADGQFREDLFYRLQVVEVVVPPLRDRREDIPLLVDHFCRDITGDAAEKRFARESMARLMGHDWPGNVREFDNEVRRALALADGMVQVQDLSERLQAARSAGAAVLADDSRGSLKEILDGFEREVLLATLERVTWNVRQAAKELGVSRAALYTRLNRFSITREEHGPGR